VEAAVQTFLSRAEVSGPLGLDRAPYAGGGSSAPARVAEAADAVAPTVLGQHRLTYIVATDGGDLLIVDQHAAHERVRFERLRQQLQQRAVESQRLLVPLVLEIAPELRPVLDASREDLDALGYDVEAFGGMSTRVRAVPAVLGTGDPGLALERVLRDLLEREAGDWMVSGPRDRLAATLACHSAVRAGQGLSPESMAAIVNDLGRTSEPLLCPHGRPTIVRIRRDEVSRWFGRSGWKRQ
jgi:DNA mismatch repair protein MutL